MSLPLKKQPDSPSPEPIRPVPSSFTVGARWMNDEDVRLNADFYADEVVRAKHLLASLRDDAQAPLGGDRLTSAIYNMGRFTRVYASDPTHGYPYLEAKEVFHFIPQSERYLSQRYAPKHSDKHMAEPGSILITCSGTVGRVTLASERLRGFFLTHDLIRVVPATQEHCLAGYLCAYLQAWPAQAIMTKQKYGGPIRHLEPKHIAPLAVMLPAESEQIRIGQIMERAYKLRDKSASLLDEATKMLISETGLPELATMPQLSFTIPSGGLECRLDGSYHSPQAAAVRQLVIDSGKHSVLGKLARPSIPGRFRRIYVNREHGIPLLQGTHIAMSRPYDMRYLSRSAHTDIAKWQIQPGWVLMSCSGTIGRTMLAPMQLADWAASQHIARIVAEDGDLAAYLSVFLSSTYGQVQVQRGIHGGVIDEIAVPDIESVHVPLPKDSAIKKIAQLAMDASALRWESVDLEEAAITEVEMLLEHGLTEYNEVLVDQPTGGSEQFDRFKDMTRRLLQVPKAELDALTKQSKKKQ